MGDVRGVNLTDKYVVLSREYFRGDDPVERVFLARWGFGTDPNSLGNAVYGTFVFDGEKTRVERYMVERLATDEEVAAAEALFVKRGEVGGTVVML